MKMPKISVLVPVYDVEKYLRTCLDSIINQTFKDIEVILVDDGSTDGSGVICDDYAKRDKRIQVVHKPKNEGSLLARKTAALKARGAYTVFIDSDDLLSNPDSLQIMYDAISSERVDILQFSIEFLHPDGSKTVADDSTWFKVYTEKIIGEVNIIKTCIDDHYNWCLSNKIFKTSICKKACKWIKDIYLITAEDCYAYFITAFYANTFKGLKTVPLYTYRQGSGVTRFKNLQLDRFSMFCRENLIVGWVKEFLSAQKLTETYKQIYKEILENLSKRFLHHTLWRYDQLENKYIKTAQDYIFKYFHATDVFEILHETFSQLRISQDKQCHDILTIKQDIERYQQTEQGLRADIEAHQRTEQGLREDIAKHKQVEQGLRADIERHQQTEQGLRSDIAKHIKTELRLNQRITFYDDRLRQIKDFNIGRYLRTKVLSKVSVGKARERLKDQYQYQKHCYRLIKKGGE